MRSINGEFGLVEQFRRTSTRRPHSQRYARAITNKMKWLDPVEANFRSWPQEETPNASYPSPGKGVSGETRN